MSKTLYEEIGDVYDMPLITVIQNEVITPQDEEIVFSAVKKTGEHTEHQISYVIRKGIIYVFQEKFRLDVSN